MKLYSATLIITFFLQSILIVNGLPLVDLSKREFVQDNHMTFDFKLDQTFLDQVSGAASALLQRNPVDLNIDRINEVMNVPLVGNIGTKNLTVRIVEAKNIILAPKENALALGMNEAKFIVDGDLLIHGFNTLKFQMNGTFKTSMELQILDGNGKTSINMDKPSFNFSKLDIHVFKTIVGGPAVPAIINALEYIFKSQIAWAFEKMILSRLKQTVPVVFQALFTDYASIEKLPFAEKFRLSIVPKRITPKGLSVAVTILVMKDVPALPPFSEDNNNNNNNNSNVQNNNPNLSEQEILDLFDTFYKS